MRQNAFGRVVYLDLLRVLATFAVIVLHVTCLDFPNAYRSYDWYVAAVGESLVHWAVPLFVMISGALFLNPDKVVSIADVFKKYIRRIAIAYLFWWLFYSVIVVCIKAIETKSLTIGLYMFLPHFHLWFLPMLICVYILIPLLKKISLDLTTIRYLIIVWLIYIAISFFFKHFNLSHTIIQIQNLFQSDHIIGYAGYFLLGYYLTQKSFNKSQLRIIYLLGIVGAFIAVGGGILLSRISGFANESFLDNLSVHNVLIATAIFVGIKENSHKIGTKVTMFLSYTQKDLFGIYLTHALWLLILNRPLFRDLFNHAITLPIISVVIFFCSLYTTKLIRLIPRLRNVVE